MPEGDLTLYVGLYDANSGERLPIAGGDAANRLPLAWE